MYQLNKQPREAIMGVAIDFSSRLDTSETLSSITVSQELLSGVEGIGSQLTISGLSVGGGIASTNVAGGYDGCVYKLTYLVTGNKGNILESEIKLKVKEL